jgi:hypothetical protein
MPFIRFLRGVQLVRSIASDGRVRRPEFGVRLRQTGPHKSASEYEIFDDCHGALTCDV